MKRKKENAKWKLEGKNDKMLQLEANIKELIEAANIDLYYYAGDGIDAELNYPAIKLKSNNSQDLEAVENIRYELHAFMPYPDYCKTFEEARTKAKDKVNDLKNILRELIFQLTRKDLNFGWSRIGNITYDIYPIEMTERREIAVVAKGVFQKELKRKDCTCGYFDVTLFRKKMFE